MKPSKTLFTLAAAVLVLAGCSKQEPAPPTADDAKKASESAGSDLRKTAEAAKSAGEKVVTDTTKQAQETAAAATGKVQEMIDKAKSLIAESKFQDASTLLQQLAGQSLTTEQQKLVDGLKEQIQKALAAKATSDGASAVGNLLKK